MQLTESERIIGRRNFIKATATLPAVGAFALAATNAGPVKTGIVGTGMEGRILISCADPNYLYLTASCDIRPDNRDLGAKAIAENHYPEPKVYENYDDMLADPELEAVIVATPLKYHGPMTLAALQAGKHVFVEKTMAYDLDDCKQMVRTAKQNNLVLQVGHQRFYNPLYWDAYRMVREGLLGHVYHIRALWHRNSDWNYWLHVQDEYRDELRTFDPSTWGYENIQHLVNWRWYADASHGLWTELCSHQIAITNWLFGNGREDALPIAVMASGGKYKSDEDQDALYLKYEAEFEEKTRTAETTAADFEAYRRLKQGYERDDRTIADHIYAIFEYPENRTVTYSAIQSNSLDKYYEQIMGTYGTVILGNENEMYLYWEPGWDEERAQSAVDEQKATRVQVVEEDRSQTAFAAHVSEEATGGGGAGDLSPLDPYRWELQGFAHTIRTGAPNLCDGQRGLLAAQACFAGQEALRTQQRVEIRPVAV